MKILIIHDPQNTFIGTILKNGSGWFRKDGDEFERRAKSCAAYYRSNDNRVIEMSIEGKNAYEKRQDMFRELECFANVDYKFDRVIFLCHGAKKHLDRKMISMLNIQKFAFEKLLPVLKKDAAVILYSCNTAGLLNGGFAKTLSILTGGIVAGHTNSGHTTNNLYKRIFNINKFSNLWPGKKSARKQLSKDFWAHEYEAFNFVEESIGDTK